MFYVKEILLCQIKFLSSFSNISSYVRFSSFHILIFFYRYFALFSVVSHWPMKQETADEELQRGLLSYTWLEYGCLFFMSKKVFLSSLINSVHVSS